MVSTVGLLQTVHDELAAVCDGATGVPSTDVERHVGLLNRVSPADVVTPFFGFEWFVEPIERGIDGSVHVEAVRTDGSGVGDVVLRTERRATVDVGIVVGGDDARRRDEYYEAVHERFAPYVRVASLLHDDVDDVSSGEGEPTSLTDGLDAGLRQRYVIEFHSTTTTTVPTAEIIDASVTADDSNDGAYPN